MRLIGKYILLVILALSFSALSAEAAKRPRKLPASAYIKSAKIEILSGDKERYLVAVAMLDSLFMHYGPHAEGLNLMAATYIDFTDKTPDPWGKKPYAEKIVAYFDSLRICCASKKVKSNYKKDCKKLVEKSDSTRVKYWREFYNAGIEQLNYMGDVAKDLKEIKDSASREFSLNVIQTNIDSCIANMELAILFDSTDFQTYIAAGSAYEHKENWTQAIFWFSKGLEAAPDSTRDQLLPYIAYDYIRLDEYCEAIPYFKEMVERNPEDSKTMGHLASCYNNCEFFDSAAVVYRKILANDPENGDVLTNIGRYFNQIARTASDSSNFYRDAKNEEKANFWRDEQMKAFDSSSAYFKQVFDLMPDNPSAAEEYGLVSAIRSDYENAAIAYSRLTTMEPDNSGHWTYLGDCYLNLQRFPEAVEAYEHVVAIDDSDRKTWLRLYDLYRELGQTAKAAEAKKKSE
ncbi:MAG: tetratricopeptide repeat protein [bacterium]|nr:tetratricopeptide repeat protein [bacterium]